MDDAWSRAKKRLFNSSIPVNDEYNLEVCANEKAIFSKIAKYIFTETFTLLQKM